MDFSAHNPRSSNALNLAAKNNDVINLKRLIRKINPNVVDNRGWTCLHEAAFHDSFECLKIILKHRDCRPLVESHEGHTALYVACLSTFSTRCIQYLLKNIDDIANYGSREEFTPLHLVSRQGRTDVLELLIQHGAILDVVDLDGDTPLHEACMGRQPETVNILVHAGAQPEVKNCKNATPLHIACSRGSFECIRELYHFITDINALDCHGYTPLMAACFGENEDVIEFLLEHGADPNVASLNGKMAVDFAVEKGLVRGFKMIFQVTDRDEISIDLFCLAISPSYFIIEIIDILLASDLDPEYFMFTRYYEIEALECTSARHRPFVPCYDDFAPLSTFLDIAEYIFCKMSAEKLEEYLYLFLIKGMSVNAVYFDEMPPLVCLHCCRHYTCFEYVFKLLMALGADVDYCSAICRYNRGSVQDSSINKVQFPKEQELATIVCPDAFYASLLLDPTTLPLLVSYSLHCDPGYVLKYAYDFGVIARLSNTTISQLTRMIDSECEISDYEDLQRYVPSLKHLSRLQVRHTITQRDGTYKSTQDFFNILRKLPVPNLLKQYLRFL